MKPKLKLLEAENASTPEKEFIRLDVLENTNLKLYGIVDKTFDEKGETDTFRHLFSFPDWSVKQGDRVRLYSGKGENKTLPKKEPDDLVTHLIYWGSDKCIWNDTGDTAYLIRYSVIDKTAVPAVKKA